MVIEAQLKDKEAIRINQRYQGFIKPENMTADEMRNILSD